MLVEFSSWETADTSLRLTASKRKRRRGGSTSSAGSVEKGSSKDDGSPFLLAGSVVTNRAGRRKKRATGSSDSARALFTLTSPHRVAIMVEKNNNKSFSPGAPPSEALDAACYMHESPKLQYTSRPGESTSFLVNSSNSCVSKNGISNTPAKNDKTKPIPHVPVVFDAKNDRLFALQAGNTRLVFWDANTEGPDNVDASLGAFDLFERATSLALLPNGLILGSCESGRLFYASVTEKTNLKVTYLEDKKKPKESHNLGLVICVAADDETKALSSTLVSPKSKRKSIKEKNEHPSSFHIFQMFMKGCQLIIQRHELAAKASAAGASLEFQKSTDASLDLFPLGTDERFPLVKDAAILPTTIVSPETATVSFASQGHQYCCTVKLQSATMVYPPFVVPCSSKRLALVSPRVLAMGTDDELLLCDSFNGIVLGSEPLPHMLLEEVDPETWTLLSDARRGQLLVLCSTRDGLLRVATTTLKLEDEDANDESLLKTSSISLAARLSAALGESSSQNAAIAPEPKYLTMLKENEEQEGKAEDAIEKAVGALRESEVTIVSKEGRGYMAGSLVKTYEKATDSLIKALQKQKGSAEENGKRMKLTNGAKKNASESCNGLKRKPSDSFDTASLPLSFVDCVFPSMTRLALQVASFIKLSGDAASSIRQDCSVVLCRLLQTGKVSARRHFDQNSDLNRALMSLLCCMGGAQSEQKRLRSPIDFIHDMLEFCADVSESQMVTMLHYMFCRSNPLDIALATLDADELPTDHYHKVLSRRYLEDKSTETASKLVMAGAASVLEDILLYSYCNQALLSSALREQLSFGDETSLLSRLLSELAFSRSKLTMGSSTSPLNASKSLVVSAAQWIPALFDAFNDEMKGLSEDEQGDLEKLQKSLTAARRQTEILMSLEDKINDAAIAMTQKQSHTVAAKRQKTRAEEDALPSYSIERLVI